VLYKSKFCNSEAESILEPEMRRLNMTRPGDNLLPLLQNFQSMKTVVADPYVPRIKCMPRDVAFSVTFDDINPLLCLAKSSPKIIVFLASKKTSPSFTDHPKLSVIESRYTNQAFYCKIIWKTWKKL
jgi:hypothetical protein